MVFAVRTSGLLIGCSRGPSTLFLQASRKMELRESLGIESISPVLRRNRLRWFGHLQRKPDDSMECTEYPKLGGPNCRDRPKMTWMEVINKDLKELGICKKDTVDRTRWRRIISVVMGC